MMASEVARLSATAISRSAGTARICAWVRTGSTSCLRAVSSFSRAESIRQSRNRLKPLNTLKKDGHRHNQVDPVGRRHKVHQPREVSISDLGFTGKKELMRLACERQYSGRASGTRRIAADEARQLGCK